jgi:hypothetical protein
MPAPDSFIDTNVLLYAISTEPSEAVTEPDELTDRVAASLKGNTPILFDVPSLRGTPNRLNYG